MENLSAHRCCVPHCNKTRSDAVLHAFLNPKLYPQRFRTWVYAVGGDILSHDDDTILRIRRVCHDHFEQKYCTRSKRLSANAVPTLNLPGFQVMRRPLQNISNIQESALSESLFAPEASSSTSNIVLSAPKLEKQAISKGKKSFYKETSILRQQVKKLQEAKEKYALKLKRALKLTENETFKKSVQKFTSMALLFTLLQFRETKKPKMGRRFTKKEKVMSLALYKQGPKAYRWLRKIFVLPAPVTLSRMISRASLKPGVNEHLFNQLKKQVAKMKPQDKICSLIFDEMAISPNFQYNKRKDIITGFVTNGESITKAIADHALVFMVRGLVKNFKQPIYYSFCSGSTNKVELAKAIKLNIKNLTSIGLNVVATVCDQGAANVSAIKYLMEETLLERTKKGAVPNNNFFEVEGKEVVPLFDPPHLIKGIRNNMLKKNLICKINGMEKEAKWEHIINLYKENPQYKGIRLMPKLTEFHVDPNKIKKMKVKCATQVFSQSVAINMGYLAEKGILQEESKETADVLLFFDELFDSFNGSYHLSKKKPTKHLLRAATPNSAHEKIWKDSIEILNSMKFKDIDSGKTSVVPLIKNWIKTIENIIYLKKKLEKLDVKSMWMRHLNQDPLENFFGCVRSHGSRNTNPTCCGFDTAFTALLINNISAHSPGANCEEDNCKNVFKSLTTLFFSESKQQKAITEIDFAYVLGDQVLLDFNVKKRDPKVMAALEYVAGFVLKKVKQIYKRCKTCTLDLSTDSTSYTNYLELREHIAKKKLLTYPSINFLKTFSFIQDLVSHILKNQSTVPNIKNYIKTVLSVNLNYNFITCNDHKKDVILAIEDIACNFFLFNYCKDLNKILKGIRSDVEENDSLQKMCLDYRKKHTRNSSQS